MTVEPIRNKDKHEAQSRGRERGGTRLWRVRVAWETRTRAGANHRVYSSVYEYIVLTM
jgi:hypothetical protein